LLLERDATTTKLDDEGVLVALLGEAMAEFILHFERTPDDGVRLVSARVRIRASCMQVGLVICVHLRPSAVKSPKEKRPGRVVGGVWRSRLDRER
jgi:hypothetical protein